MNDLVRGPINRTLLRLAAPNIASTLSISGLSIAEAAYLGRLGDTALAAVALVFPVFMLANMLSSGAIGGAVSGATARAIGADDIKQAEAVLRAAICVAIFFGLLMTALVLVFGAALYTLIGGGADTADISVINNALSYSSILFGVVVVIWVHNIIASALRGCGDMLRPAISTGLITLSYIGIGYLTIFGRHPIPKLGIQGSAIAIILAYGVGVIFLGTHLMRRRSRLRIRRGPVTWSALRPILANGLLASNQSVMTVTLALVSTAFIGQLGVHWLAGYGIGVRLELLLVPIIFGVGGALITMTGANVGANQRRRAIKIAWRGVFFTAIAIGAIGLVLSLFPDLWSQRFSSEIATIAACNLYLKIVGPFYAFFALGLCMYFASQGLETLFVPVVGTALRLLIVVGGGLWLSSYDGLTTDSLTTSITATRLLTVFASAMTIYGLFVAVTLYLGPWSIKKKLDHKKAPA